VDEVEGFINEFQLAFIQLAEIEDGIDQLQHMFGRIFEHFEMFTVLKRLLVLGQQMGSADDGIERCP
jgi:hypothetical protein